MNQVYPPGRAIKGGNMEGYAGAVVQTLGGLPLEDKLKKGGAWWNFDLPNLLDEPALEGSLGVKRLPFVEKGADLLLGNVGVLCNDLCDSGMVRFNSLETFSQHLCSKRYALDAREEHTMEHECRIGAAVPFGPGEEDNVPD